MNTFCIKPHIPEGEDGLTLPSLDSSISTTISLLYSVTTLSLATLLTEAVFHTPYNELWYLHLLRLVSSFILYLFIPFKPPPIASTSE